MRKINEWFQRISDWGITELMLEGLFPRYAFPIKALFFSVWLYIYCIDAVGNHLSKNSKDEQEEPYDNGDGDDSPSTIPSIFELSSNSLSPRKLLRQAEREFKEGHRYSGVEKLVDALSSSTELKKKQLLKAIDLFHNHYPSAIQESDNIIRELHDEPEGLTNRERVRRCRQLTAHYHGRLDLHRKVSALPDYIRGTETPSDQLSVLQNGYKNSLLALQEAKEKHAESLYVTAVALLKSQDMAKVRYAYKFITECIELIPNYKNAKAIQAKAKRLATYYVRVSTIDDLSNNSDAAGYFRKAMLAQLTTHRSYSFLTILSPQDTIKPNLELRIHFLNYEKEIHPKSAPKIYKVQEKIEHEDGSSSTSKGEISVYSKYSNYKVQGNYELVELPTNTIIEKTENIPGYSYWNYEWATLSSGTKDALDKDQRSLVNKQEKPFPNEKAMKQEITRKLALYLNDRLKSKFKSLGK